MSAISVRGKKVLVTGGTGFVGSRLTAALLGQGARVVRLFSNDEYGLHAARKTYGEDARLRYLHGDVRDFERVRQATEGIDVVFHLAGLKHVWLCEYNPFEALQTNILGTQNVVRAALEQGVGRTIFTSTDKAAYPSNTMGVSKLFAEKLVTDANFYRGRHRSLFASVRFGNVLGSRGSAVPLFLEQIRRGGPVTVTDPAMTRFVMTADDAARLMLKSLGLACGGEIFIFKMHALKLGALVDALVRRAGKKGRKVRVSVTGPEAGEKSYEDLMTEEEAARALETRDMYIVRPAFRFSAIRYGYGPEKTRPAEIRPCRSEGQKPLSPREIDRILDGAGIA